MFTIRLTSLHVVAEVVVERNEMGSTVPKHVWTARAEVADPELISLELQSQRFPPVDGGRKWYLGSSDGSADQAQRKSTVLPAGR